MTDIKAAPKPAVIQWVSLVLLVISVAINYADRGNLGVAASNIQADLRLDPNQIGILSTAFFWSYALFQLVAGYLIDRWNVNWVYAVGFLIWSAATGVTGLVSSFGVIFLLRLLLGAGESIAYPSYSKIIATSFPEHLRGTANGLIDVGSKIGPALGVMIGFAMLRHFSWRGMFLVIGGASLIWLAPWCITAAKLPTKRIAKASQWAPPYRELLKNRKLWGTCIGLFGGNYTWYFYLTWLPYYFERERHLPKSELLVIASLPFWAVALSALICGPLADRIIHNGRDAGRVRQMFLCIGLIGCAAFMLPAMLVPDQRLSIGLFLAASVFMGAWSSNHWALTQRLSGAPGAGRWTAFQNCLGNFSGVAGGWITGRILLTTHSFTIAFAVACTILLFAVCGYWFVVGRPDPVIWSTVPEPVDLAVPGVPTRKAI